MFVNHLGDAVEGQMLIQWVWVEPGVLHFL